MWSRDTLRKRLSTDWTGDLKTSLLRHEVGPTRTVPLQIQLNSLWPPGRYPALSSWGVMSARWPLSFPPHEDAINVSDLGMLRISVAHPRPPVIFCLKNWNEKYISCQKMCELKIVNLIEAYKKMLLLEVVGIFLVNNFALVRFLVSLIV